MSKKTSWVIEQREEKETPWGNEYTWSSNNNVLVKTLNLVKGKKTSFKYNTTKDEMLIVLSGNIYAFHGDEEVVTTGYGDFQTTNLTQGMAFYVQSGCPYRLQANEDSVILEVSTSGRGNIVRLHDEYGRDCVQVNDRIKQIIKKSWG
jgi:mannose-6-phosphate isomerase-like protein (cupin superfamily)